MITLKIYPGLNIILSPLVNIFYNSFTSYNIYIYFLKAFILPDFSVLNIYGMTRNHKIVFRSQYSRYDLKPQNSFPFSLTSRVEYCELELKIVCLYTSCFYFKPKNSSYSLYKISWLTTKNQFLLVYSFSQFTVFYQN